VAVTANLEEKKLTHVRLGDPVEIHVDSYPDHHFSGKVFAIKAMAASQVSLLPPDNATGNFTKVEQRVPIKITLEQTGDASDNLNLFPGMSVEVKMRIR
jgi:membrane fusion protein (multidrug efflux system)